MKELDRFRKYLDSQLMDFEERLKNCKKVIQENALQIKQQEKFMETMNQDKEGEFVSRIKQETIDKNREAEESRLQKLKEEGRQRAFLYKSLETQYVQIKSIKQDLLLLESENYVFLKKEEFLKQVEEKTKEAVKEAKKTLLKEAKENQKKEAAKEVKKQQKQEAEASEEMKKAVEEYAQVVNEYAFMDPGRVLTELELLKNKLGISS